MIIVKVFLDPKTGTPIVPDDIKQRVRAGEKIHIEILPQVKSFAKNALAHGVAGLNIDGCRVETDWTQSAGYRPNYKNHNHNKGVYGGNSFHESKTEYNEERYTQGRWPANLILSQSAAALLDEMSGETNSERPNRYKRIFPEQQHIYSKRNPGQEKPQYEDEGGASRYFTVLPDSEPRFLYTPKSSTSERNEGLDGLPLQPGGCMEGNANPNPGYKLGARPDIPVKPTRNPHPTVKPLSLMRWLVRLTKTPTGGVVLDPFGGSGTTGVACLLEGRRAVLIEREAEYYTIAHHRLEHWQDEASTEPKKLRGKADDLADMPLFADIVDIGG